MLCLYLFRHKQINENYFQLSVDSSLDLTDNQYQQDGKT
ncbi:hypothetical protein PMAG_a4196 [Pseudoalteromonas mariniglutinosa NCIMB 1770]|nr:hypothetical protein [Pseudoalteromonas mariniglutinosa NCIMB 1770]